MKKIFYLISILSFASCGVPQAEHDNQVLKNDSLVTVISTLTQKVDKLTQEIDELKNGEDRTVNLINNALDAKEYLDAKKLINQLISRHPESSHISKYKKAMPRIDGELKKVAQVREKQRQDSIKLANINNLGVWLVSYFVDEFGESTKEGYIQTSVTGTFSNTATQDSPLDVRFIISSESDISIKLFEYAGNNPVKCYGSTDYYTMQVMDDKGGRHKFTATNHSERLNVVSSARLSKILKGGGTVKFRIVENDTPTTNYSFEIKNAGWYENALTKLKMSK